MFKKVNFYFILTHVLFSRGIQTNPEVEICVQTTSEVACQTKHPGFHELVRDARQVVPGQYRTAWEQDQDYLGHVMFVQRVCRGWIARRKVFQMKEDYSKQKERAEAEERSKEQEIMDRKRDEEERCENPRSKADFDMLYNRLEDWRREQEEGILAKQPRHRNRDRARLVMEEAGLLMKINRNKNLAKMDAKARLVNQFLAKAATPSLKLLSNGELIEIETPGTRFAAQLKDIHDRMREEVFFEEDRVELLVELDDLVGQHDTKLTRELRSLIKREIDLIKRSVPADCMTGLRTR